MSCGGNIISIGSAGISSHPRDRNSGEGARPPATSPAFIADAVRWVAPAAGDKRVLLPALSPAHFWSPWTVRSGVGR
jgi:hypothetical protein